MVAIPAYPSANVVLPPFASPEALEQYTKGKVRASDERASAIVAAVSASIRRRAGWHVFPRIQAHTLRLDGPGGRLLPLPTLELHAIVSLVNAGEVVAVDALDYSSGTGLVERQDGVFTHRYGQVIAVLDHGYEEAEELAQITLQLAARALSSPMGATREQAGSVSVNWGMAVQGVSGGLIPLSSELAAVESYRVVTA